MPYTCLRVSESRWLVDRLCSDKETCTLMKTLGLDVNTVRAALNSPMLQWQDMTSQLHVVQLSTSQQQRLLDLANQIVPTVDGRNRVDSDLEDIDDTRADVQVGNLLREFWCSGGTPRLSTDIRKHVADELRLSNVSVRLTKPGDRRRTGVHFDIPTEPLNIAGGTLTPLDLSVCESLCCSLPIGNEPINCTRIVKGLHLPILQSLRGNPDPRIVACMEFADAIFEAIISGLYRWLNEPGAELPFEMWEVPPGAVVNLLGVMHSSPKESNRMFLHADFRIHPKYALRDFPDGGGFSRTICERSRTWGWRLAVGATSNANSWVSKISEALGDIDSTNVTSRKILYDLMDEMNRSNDVIKFTMKHMS
jgi:hypothetical protein